MDAVADDIVGFGADTWLPNAAGLVAFYPLALPFARPSRWSSERASGDLIGDALAAAGARVAPDRALRLLEAPPRGLRAAPRLVSISREGRPWRVAER